MFLIAIEQIKKKDSGTGFICIVAGAFILACFYHYLHKIEEGLLC